MQSHLKYMRLQNADGQIILKIKKLSEKSIEQKIIPNIVH